MIPTKAEAVTDLRGACVHTRGFSLAERLFGKGGGASRAFIIKSVRKHATIIFFRRGLTTAVFIGGRKGARLPREVHNI